MKSHCINGHEYTEANTEWRKDGTFACRICRCLRQNYAKAVKRGETPDKPRTYTIDRILDLLEIDGGWWTLSAIALRLGLMEDTVRRALHRLDSDVLEERIVELAGAMGSDQLRDWRREWRFKSPLVAHDSYGEFRDVG